MCDKQSFPSEKSAKRAIRFALRSRKGQRRERRCYWCHWCKAWHLTSHEIEQFPSLAPRSERRKRPQRSALQ